MKGLDKLIKGTLMVAVATLAVTIPAKAAGSTQYKLVWSDEFDGTTLDEKNWNYNIGNGNWGWGNGEYENYTDDEKNIKVENGLLVITPRAEKNGEGKTEYTSGRINSSGKVSIKYGKIEARIKLPDEVGLWPAFWMLGQNQPKGWPYCGEIDILENWNKGKFAQSALHYENESNRPGKDTCLVGSTSLENKTQWHIYGMNWTPEKIEFSLDNKIFKKFDITSKDRSELREDEYYFIINCAIGGTLPGIGPEESFESAQMFVDYVRVYQRECDHGTAKFESNDMNQVPACTVTYKNLGAVVSTQKLQSGETASLPTVKRAKYKFGGWINATTKGKVNASSRFYSDTTVEAKWEKIRLKKAKITSTKQKYKKAISLKFKVKGKYDGFQVKAGKKTAKTESKRILIPKFKSGKTYKVKVRAYAIDSTGKIRYGKWSKTKKIKVK